MNNSTINNEELNKFAQQAKEWWNTEGPLKTLHDINESRLQFIEHYLSLTGLTLLDVGCGGGILCEAMAKAGAIVTGIDAEQEVIQAAQEHAHHNNLSIQYECTPIETYQGTLYDAITCMELLEHVEHPQMIFEHCSRLLKPKGLLFLSTINRTIKAYASVIVAAEYVLNLLPRLTHDYQKFIRPSELMTMARPFHFSLVDMKGLDYNPILRTASLSSKVQVNYLLALQKNESN
jgi:2-polyprenyl-6-hydroxyphenyl methylase/3-demethylubiquinone-9 3-methyltransferase